MTDFVAATGPNTPSRTTFIRASLVPLGYLFVGAAAIATYVVLSVGPAEFVASPPPYRLSACTTCSLQNASSMCPTSLFAHVDVPMQFCSTQAAAPCCCPTIATRRTSYYDGVCPPRDAQTCTCSFREMPQGHAVIDIIVVWKASLAAIFVLVSFSVWMYRLHYVS